MKAEVFEALRAARTEKRAVVLTTKLPSGEQRLFEVHAQPAAPASGDGLWPAVRAAAAEDRASVVEIDGTRWFVQPFNPPLRMVIVGAVHIAQALAPMAALAGYEVSVVDPRAAFSTEERFPGVHRVLEWPDRALADLGLDERTAVVTVTHDPKLDDPALAAALASRCFYIGCLGSGKTHAGRQRRLRARGFDDAALARLHGPVGLRIGARTPMEIAVSILAEVVGTLRGALPPRTPTVSPGAVSDGASG